MDAYSLHLAMAALAGASVAAVSAYYAHRKAVAQLLDFALVTETDRHHRRLRSKRRSGDRRRSGPLSDVAADDAVGKRKAVGRAHRHPSRAVFDALAERGTYESGEISSDFSPH